MRQADSRPEWCDRTDTRRHSHGHQQLTNFSKENWPPVCTGAGFPASIGRSISGSRRYSLETPVPPARPCPNPWSATNHFAATSSRVSRGPLFVRPAFHLTFTPIV